VVPGTSLAFTTNGQNTTLTLFMGGFLLVWW